MKNKFRGFFGKKNHQEDENQSVNIVDYPDEIHEVKEAVESETEQSVKADTNPVDVNSEAKADSSDEVMEETELNFKDIPEMNKDTIDDKIDSIRENALHTYAKPENGPDDNKEKTIEADAVKNPDNDTISSNSYDMSQLLTILKNNGEAYTDDEDGISKKKSKKKNKGDFTDEASYINDIDAEKEPNEYHYSFEYSDPVQGKDLFKCFRKSAVISTISVALTLIFTIFCFWFECGRAAGLPFSHMMQAGYYGKFYAMLSLQLLSFCILFNLDGIARGLRKLSFKSVAPESVAVISVFLCVIHTLYTAFVQYNSEDYTTFCFIGCVILLFLSVNTFVKAYTRFKSFTMVLSSKPKLTTVKLDALSDESSIFSKYLNEDSEVFAIKKTGFVSDFVKNSYTVPKAAKFCNIMLYVVVAFSVVIGFVKLYLLDSTMYQAINSAMTVALFSIPVTFLMSMALPYFITSMKAFKRHTAIIGEAACDSIENAGVISFDDTEVFPPKMVKVTSIKTYNDYRIDKAIVVMAKAFNKIGGPLSYVFVSSVQESVGDGNDVMVLESAKDGLHFSIAGEDILVGNRNYLKMFDVEAPIDDNDEEEIRSLTNIVYLVSDGQLSAKFYIKYSLNRNFKKVLSDLYDAGFCCGIKTYDPSIDNRLIEGNLNDQNYPMSVVKNNIKELGAVEEKTSSSLISISGIHNYLLSFLMLDRLRGVYKTNIVFGILGSVLGLAMSMTLVFLGRSITSGLFVAFYLLWMIPLLLVSFLKK